MSDSDRGEIVLVKFGGSLITDKREERSVRDAVLARLARELAGALAEPEAAGLRVVLGHGSGSFGHVAAERYGLVGIVESERQVRGVAVTQDQAAQLHRIVVAALLGAGLAPYSLAPASCFVGDAGEPVALDLEPLTASLRLGLLPVVFGDVVMDRAHGASILSTETVFLGLARHAGELPIARAVWLGETDGVYDAAGATVPRVDRSGLAKLAAAVEGAAGVDVTGGMRHRIESALRLAEAGVPSIIANGRRPGLLRDALLGYQVLGTHVASMPAVNT